MGGPCEIRACKFYSKGDLSAVQAMCMGFLPLQLVLNSDRRMCSVILRVQESTRLPLTRVLQRTQSRNSQNEELHRAGCGRDLGRSLACFALRALMCSPPRELF